MWHVLTTIKELTLKQSGNDVGKSHDQVKILKLEITQKDGFAYSKNAYIKYILEQLQTAPVDLFANMCKALESKRLLGKK